MIVGLMFSYYVSSLSLLQESGSKRDINVQQPSTWKPHIFDELMAYFAHNKKRLKAFVEDGDFSRQLYCAYTDFHTPQMAQDDTYEMGYLSLQSDTEFKLLLTTKNRLQRTLVISHDEQEEDNVWKKTSKGAIILAPIPVVSTSRGCK